MQGNLPTLSLIKWRNPYLLQTNIQCIFCWGKREYPLSQLTFCSGQIGGSVKDLLSSVDSWAHSTGRWVSDSGVRLWNRTRVILGHLHTASVPNDTSHSPLFLHSLPELVTCLSIYLFWFSVFCNTQSFFQYSSSLAKPGSHFWGFCF